MPRPIRTVKPPSAPGATGKSSSKKSTKPTTTTTTTTTTTINTKSRATRSGTKDRPHTLLTPTSDDPAPPKKPTTRATRSKRVSAPAPAPRTTRRKPAPPEPEPEQDPTPTLPPARDATATPVRTHSPEIQVPASSNAENRTPARTPTPTHFRSSPPPMPPLTTTTAAATTTKRLMALEFGSDAGYSPPPPSRPTSAQRPRLRELQPLSLEPLDGTDSEGEAEGENGAASPTPKRGRRSGFANVSVDEEREGGGQGQDFWMPGDEEAFTIYSDPKSPPRLPSASASGEARELDDTMRPPESSSPSPLSPPHTRVMRKRRSSGAIVDEEDVAVADGAADGADKGRKGKRRKAAAAAAKTMTTEDLRDLLPRRRRVVEHERDEYDVISTSEDAVESESDGDELARPMTRKKAATAAKAAKGAKTKKKLARTYARAEKENDSPNRAAAAAAAAESSGDETVVAGGGREDGIGGRVRRSMKEVVDKFKEVDRWEMEFEDVSQGSLEAGSEGAR